MLKPAAATAQTELEMVTLDQLVPRDHLLRLIDTHIRFDFIREKTEGLYCSNNGRPAIDPVVLFKMLFIGYLFGVRSERQLVREVEVNVAYRWFLGLRLTDKVPDASTLSQNRRRRFAGTGIEQDIFDTIVEQAIEHKLIGGRVLYTDSTHLKANANKRHYDLVEVEQTPAAYLAELDAAVDAERAAAGQKPLRRATAGPVGPSDAGPPDADPDREHGAPAAPSGLTSDAAAADTRQIKRSTVDPEAGFMVRDQKPVGFFYLDHRTVDGVHALIVDTHVTPGNVNDATPYLARLDRARTRFDLKLGAVGLDAGYFTPWVCKGIVERGLYGVMGYRRPSHREGYFHKREYAYDPQTDSYRCPAGQIIVYRGTNRMGYREYASDPGQCRQCPQRGRCTQSQNTQKLITRHLWQHFKEQIDAHRLTDLGKRLYAPRKETVERSFADAKQLHGHRYARFRGLAKVQAQCLLSAACQNMKKIALLLARRAAALFNPKFWLYGVPTGYLRPRHIVFIQTSSTGPGCYPVFPVV
jgi:transposase